MSRRYSGGDLLAVQKQAEQPFALTVDLVDGTSVTVLDGASLLNIVVQKMTLTITTHADGASLLVTDSNFLTYLAAHTDAPAGANVPSTVVWDFGPHGVPIPRGTGLVVSSGAGGSFTYMAGYVHIEGYRRRARGSGANLTFLEWF